MRDRAKPCEPERCDFPELRAWYAALHNRLKSEPDLPAGEIIATWLRVARPMVKEVPEPSKDERRHHPGRYVRTRDGKWLTRLREVPTEYDGPMENEPDVVMYLDRIVPAVRAGGRTVHDREEALGSAGDTDSARQLIIGLLPSGRALGYRKGVHSDTLARALLLWSLSQGARKGYQRRAARCVIVWDDELDVGNTNPDIPDLVRRFQTLEGLNDGDTLRRENAEAAVVTTSRHIWGTIGLQAQEALRI
jgi:hypothetical protein